MPFAGVESSVVMMAPGWPFVGAVIEHDAEPTPGLDWVEQHEQSIVCGEVDDAIHMREISFVRFGEIVRATGSDCGGKGQRAIDGAAVGSPAGIGGTEEIYPDRVEAMSRTVGEECVGFRFRKIDDQRLRRIAKHQ